MKKIIFFFFLIFSYSALADTSFPNVKFLQEGQHSPKANLQNLHWLAGHWRGEAFGGVVEEVWAPPLGGSMMGAFKLVVSDKVQFYEIETISEVNNSLIFRLKHFSKDLKGWEEKDKTVDFTLVEIQDNTFYFNGLTLQKVNDHEMNIFVVIEHKGKTTEEKFSYTRVK
ncbi:hypothetical protein TDB9533_02441 [Thalassocella blandensis]|nr:hypothetical protein TDB9533_02441 [Thalassocella blandensis]